MGDYASDNLFSGWASEGPYEQQARHELEEWEETVRLRRAGELPVPELGTGLCRACGGNVALPASLLCKDCNTEVFQCSPCECGGQCDKCSEVAA